MYRIGVDIGSTFTKYCVVDEHNQIVSTFMERTPVHQKEYFENKYTELMNKYPRASIVSCGYGRENIPAVKNINELSALAMGAYKLYPGYDTVLDIGGQDSKIICYENGHLTRFYVNDRCAAGSGLFLINVMNLLGMSFEDIDLSMTNANEIQLSSVCAVFAQTEIVKLIADNTSPEDIVNAVVCHTLSQTRKLLDKVFADRILLSGGFSSFAGIDQVIEKVLGVDCLVAERGIFLSAMGCALND